MLDRLFDLMDEEAYPRTRAPAPPAPRPHVELFEHFEEDMSVWQPSELPRALPCPLTVLCEGRPVTGIAVVDARMAFDLPMELVPPKEAVSGGPLILEKGGCFLFSDDYVEQNPESKIAKLVRAFGELKSIENEKVTQEVDIVELAEDAEFPEHTASATRRTGATPSTSSVPSAATSMTSAPKSRMQRVRQCIQEAEKEDRPLFRRQDPSIVYGQAKYVKRDFHAILDEEYPIEYFI